MTNEEALKIMKDYREILIKANEIYYNPDFEKAKQAYDLSIEALEEKIPKGEWIKITSPLSTETVVKCPYCKDEFIGNDVEDYNCCPNCCARMINHVKEN